MTAAFLDGLRRVLGAPALLGGVYLVTLLAAVPLTLALHHAISSHLGVSVAADTVAGGVNWEWWEEFSAGSSGFERTFTPLVIGFAAVLSNLSALVDGTGLQGEIAAVVVCYLAVWAFLVGGAPGSSGPAAARNERRVLLGVRHLFFRFCRLAVFAGLAYWALFGVLQEWLLDDRYSAATRNLTVERTAFVVRLALYVLFGAMVLLVNLVFDYAKIRAVVEDRRSMIGALLAAVRFARRRPAATVGLYLLNGALFLLILGAYAIVAPGAGTDGASMWMALLVGQAYVIARLFAKLVFYASQTAYFQGQLAHAGYVAAPRPVWPESAAAEGITGPTHPSGPVAS